MTATPSGALSATVPLADDLVTVWYRCPGCESPLFWSAQAEASPSLQPIQHDIRGPRPQSEEAQYGGPGSQWVLNCSGCRVVYPVLHGIPRLMTDADLRQSEPFLRHYERVREGEGMWFSLATVRELPNLPTHGYPPELVDLWARRRHAYRKLLAILAGKARTKTDPLAILELGAGTGWLAARLSTLGYRILATDINVDPVHGLGMARRVATGPPHSSRSGRIPRGFGCVQAGMERLPFAGDQFDLVIAAASLHYACTLDRAVAEAARVLLPGGAILLLDTPLYRSRAAGEAVVARRLAEQRARFGSDGTGTTGAAYIARPDLQRTFARAGLGFREVPVHGPLRAGAGHARRWVRRALQRPEQAIMPIVIGEKAGVAC